MSFTWLGRRATGPKLTKQFRHNHIQIYGLANTNTMSNAELPMLCLGSFPRMNRLIKGQFYKGIIGK